MDGWNISFLLGPFAFFQGRDVTVVLGSVNGTHFWGDQTSCKYIPMAHDGSMGLVSLPYMSTWLLSYGIFTYILLMEEILHHLGRIKP